VPPSEPPDCGAAAQAARLVWFKLPDLPPHREPYKRLRFQGRARNMYVLPTDAVLVRTEALEPAGIRATYHHSRKAFFVEGSAEPMPGVVAWALAPQPSPP